MSNQIRVWDMNIVIIGTNLYLFGINPVHKQLGWSTQPQWLDSTIYNAEMLYFLPLPVSPKTL